MPTQDQKPSALDRMIETAESLATVSVITIVGDVEITYENDKWDHRAKESQGIPGLCSKINLATGDIVHAINAKFTDTENDPILKFHREQVGIGCQIARNNVEIIATLVERGGEKLLKLLDSTGSREAHESRRTADTAGG